VERQQQNSAGLHALVNQPCHAVRERVGLARARAGDDEQRPVTMSDGLQLLRVKASSQEGESGMAEVYSRQDTEYRIQVLPESDMGGATKARKDTKLNGCGRTRFRFLRLRVFVAIYFGFRAGQGG